MKRRFLRADTFRYSRLGKSRPKLQKWRRPRGKHNKIRLKRFSHPLQPGIGYKVQKKDSGRIFGQIPVLISNQGNLEKLRKSEIVILSRRLGAKKKVEIMKKAAEMGIRIFNAGGKK